MAAVCLYLSLFTGRAPALLAGGLGLVAGSAATLVACCLLLQGSAESQTQGLGLQEVCGACLGLLLGTGAAVLWPAARRVRLRPARAGCVLGGLGGGGAYVLLQLLCWTSKQCLLA